MRRNERTPPRSSFRQAREELFRAALHVKPSVLRAADDQRIDRNADNKTHECHEDAPEYDEDSRIRLDELCRGECAKNAESHQSQANASLPEQAFPGVFAQAVGDLCFFLQDNGQEHERKEARHDEKECPLWNPREQLAFVPARPVDLLVSPYAAFG